MAKAGRSHSEVRDAVAERSQERFSDDDLFPPELKVLLRRIAGQDRARSEATLQADIRQLLLTANFGLTDQDLDVDLETAVGDGRRIDIELGCVVIEVKRSLARPGTVKNAVQQLAGYVRTRTERSGQHYLGVLTDGAQWRAYHLSGGHLVEITRHTISATRPNAMALFFWLEGVLATGRGVTPTPSEIGRRLGAESSAHAVDRAALAALYAEHAETPTVALKRQLWAQLLRSALGTQFIDDDDLFIEHTLLMNTADVIAHLVAGLDVLDLEPATILSGQRFDRAQILGVVEPDFFDWTIEVPGGSPFIRSLARRVARFDWSEVEHDVLKVLYESIIGRDTRKRMGEYYTPDWLAERIVETCVRHPLSQRVLDPACGSGTFLFHAVRRYLDAAERDGTPLAAALTSLSSHVIGIDLHPVAVALARVTYLLAIGHERLIRSDRGAVTVPVYLGDSMQWRERLDLFTEEHLKISAGYGESLYEDILRFPEKLLTDAAHFDRLVSGLAGLAAKPRDPGTLPSLTALFRRLAVAPEDRPMITETFAVMCRLHDEDRNHIWNYYIRNLVRPVWLAMPDNRVDVLIGNPPWLSYRNMPPEMQVLFQQLSKERGLWHSKQVATHQDLSALFVARTVQQYLNVHGTFGFVLPNAALDRDYFDGFRSGWYEDIVEPTAVAFSKPWDLRRLRPHFFPRGSCVVFGRRAGYSSRKPLPRTAQCWSGVLPKNEGSWRAVSSHITRTDARLVGGHEETERSPYADQFAEGATIVPRVLFMVETDSAGPLGLGGGRQAVRSGASSYEKRPWRDLRRLEGVVEVEFVRPVLLGENIVPFRVLSAREAILPIIGDSLADGTDSRIDYYPGLAEWWEHAVATWEKYRTSDRLTLTERLNFRRGLTNQLPTAQFRVVYGKAGMHVAAALVDDGYSIIDHKLYWGSVATREEGLYLCTIINSPAITELVRPFMSYGKDERDIDKHLWRLPIPRYDAKDAVHQRLVQIGIELTDEIASLSMVDAGFVALRRRVREFLSRHATASEIDQLVRSLIET
ncbi:SAM-dependent methyltransferase [Amycolatopsis bartoniae]|uniref:N-6 DNA methylase n=1 Tax=Amycolatopsis bartoniae TaxID=941986 RepID=UPI0011952625|nr:N-6 DNA methylase [Amycolatopsis bartoniae]MBB2938115.1 SAM-dependent methyltransferase [Amycolatopsis bartoniae]TVT01263.1 SAM-dependent DNA methyltransferase [Amycolatopsis bartoniae]